MYEGNDRPPEVWFLENTVWNAQLRSKIPGLDIENCYFSGSQAFYAPFWVFWTLTRILFDTSC